MSLFNYFQYCYIFIYPILLDFHQFLLYTYSIKLQGSMWTFTYRLTHLTLLLSTCETQPKTGEVFSAPTVFSRSCTSESVFTLSRIFVCFLFYLNFKLLKYFHLGCASSRHGSWGSAFWLREVGGVTLTSTFTVTQIHVLLPTISSSKHSTFFPSPAPCRKVHTHF